MRHAVELGSRIYITNPSATTDDLKTAVASHLLDVPVNNFTIASAAQTVGTATTQHITWSYNTTLSVPFIPSLPMNFSGAIDVPTATLQPPGPSHWECPLWVGSGRSVSLAGTVASP